MSDIIAEAECPACGKIVQFETLGEQPCDCGEMIGELAIEWKGVDD